ncbi:flagellin [Salinispirillum marinum]|uniref:Flagellin n=2 Tax=Saccharospirillaceae TaxID=255527 RepID=A0ABV8BD41_9GAMM
MAINFSSAPSVSTNSVYPGLVQQASSGVRINQAADDAAGAAIVQGLSSQVNGQSVAMRNIGDGQSLLQTRGGMVSQFTEQVQRMRELAVQANNGINSPDERNLINREFETLRDGINEQIAGAEFNGRKLFSADPLSLQTGANPSDTTVVSGTNLTDTLAALDFGSLQLGGDGDLSAVLDRLDDSLAALTDTQVQDGAASNRLDQQANQLVQSRIDNSTARSGIQDTDIAELASQLAQDDVQNRAQLLLQGQANANSSNVLRLLNA